MRIFVVATILALSFISVANTSGRALRNNLRPYVLRSKLQPQLSRNGLSRSGLENPKIQISGKRLKYGVDIVKKEVLPSEVRDAPISVRKCAAPGPDRIRPEHLKNLPLVLINTLAGRST
ncbi:hypothetical protein RB195_003173 [Necator americanus]|uniref:Uncharacterized protein n=1 Tax=Necator americanus TaxID=51031 RepID=A0ABR1DMG6_NECAM